MVTLDQFIGLLRSSLLDTKGIEVLLDPLMPTHRLFMGNDDWLHFASIAFQRKHFHVERGALTSSSTIFDLYAASLSRIQPAFMRVDRLWPHAGPRLPSLRHAAYIH